MTASRFRTRPPRDFVSADAHHWPRMERGFLLLWDRADLNRALILHLDEPLDIPRITVGKNAARLRIPLLRYPAVDYRPLYESMLEEFARRGIPLRTERKSKET